MKVFVGYEEREAESFRLAVASAQRFGCDVRGLYEDRLRSSGILYRPMDTRGGQAFDLNSEAPQSTRFAIARFATPLLAHSGWALFVDGDVVFLADPRAMLAYAREKYAVCVVKHEVGKLSGLKMDNQIQTNYHRKLWSSVMLFNCDHPANRRLNLQMLNQWPGRDLHAFRWLGDDEIGELPMEFNWLVGMQPKPERPVIAHYTLGTPELKPGCEHADIWESARKECLK